MGKVNVIYQEGLGWLIQRTTSLMLLSNGGMWMYPTDGWSNFARKFQSKELAEDFCKSADLKIAGKKTPFNALEYERYKFKSPLNAETSYSEMPLGEQELYDSEFDISFYEEGRSACIEWTYAIGTEHEGMESIGLELDGYKVSGYDGVFQLPKEVSAWLTPHGFDFSEI